MDNDDDDDDDDNDDDEPLDEVHIDPGLMVPFAQLTAARKRPLLLDAIEYH